MSQEFNLQDPGEGIHEAEILEVHISPGDTVAEGDDLFTVETDKASVVIPSPFNGTVDNIAVEKGQFLEVGNVLLTYTEDERSSEDQSPPSKSGKESEKSSPAAAKSNREADSRPGREPGAVAADPDGEEHIPQTPRKPASPSTRRLARELGVEIDTVAGSGPGGRVESGDVRKAAGADGGEENAVEGAAGNETSERSNAESPEFDFGHWGEVETVTSGATRRSISEKMTTSWRNVPHVVHADFADVSRLEKLRREHEGEFLDKGTKLTITVFALKATAIALKEFPRFNASLDPASGDLILKRYCHIGVAIDTDAGLLVPVIRDVDSKGLLDIARQLTEVAQSARKGELKPRDMQGGSISLTNPGGLGATFFTPIINYPEVAIVGLGTIRKAPLPGADLAVAQDTVRCWLPLIVGFDHRVNDGADAARFAGKIGQLLEKPEDMLLAA